MVWQRGHAVAGGTLPFRRPRGGGLNREATMAIECLTVIVLLTILFSVLIFPAIALLVVLPAGILVLFMGVVIESKKGS
jgi:hypothetical protein